MMAVGRHLQAACNTISARRRATWWAGGLFGLFLVLFVAGGVPTVHGHDAPGLYDEDCPLLCLAVARPGMPLRSVPAMAPLVLALDPVLPVLVLGLTDVSRASFDPRAPPPRTHLPVLAH
jgi:hypothetical protein